MSKKDKQTSFVRVSYHFKERLLQRVHGIEESDTKMAFRINLEKDKLDAESRRIIDESEFLWQGSLWEQADICNFYLYERDGRRFIIVTNSFATEAITIYAAEFPGVPKKFGEDMMNNLIRELKKLRARRQRVSDRRVPYIERREARAKRYQELIAHYQKQLTTCETEVSAAREEMKTLENETEQLTKVLCSPMAFMRDLKRIKR